MKYMMLIAGSEEAWGSEEETKALYARVGGGGASRRAPAHHRRPRAPAGGHRNHVRIGKDGSSTVTDGPFLEGKEVVGGYGILEVADLDEALAGVTWPAPDTLEIRPIVA